jgi:hypothetical protein
MEVEQYQNMLEPLMVTHVLPEFTSPLPFLRARACWVFGQFFEIPYTSGDTFLFGLRAVLNCISDSELPVRIKAAVALRTLCISNFCNFFFLPLMYVFRRCSHLYKLLHRYARYSHSYWKYFSN